MHEAKKMFFFCKLTKNRRKFKIIKNALKLRIFGKFIGIFERFCFFVQYFLFLSREKINIVLSNVFGKIKMSMHATW